MSHRGGINRAFSWIKKVLEVTELTNVPERVIDEVRTSVDLFGWDSYTSLIALTTVGGLGIEQVTGPAVPNDVLRLVVHASIFTNSGGSNTLWMEQVLESGEVIGLSDPIVLGAQTVGQEVKVPLLNKIIQRPGDALRGRAVINLGGGVTITLVQGVIDLPIGEYIPSL